tara:strand:+ start:352 stop:468 length:117 start_codon:yes stop_codon:yes gene_type:complete
MLYLINQTPPAFKNSELVMIDIEDDDAFDKMIIEQMTN